MLARCCTASRGGTGLAVADDLDEAPSIPHRSTTTSTPSSACLPATASAWVPRHFPNGRRVGDEWRLANIRGDAPRKQGSCVIALKGTRRRLARFRRRSRAVVHSARSRRRRALKGRDLFAYAAEVAGRPRAPARRDACSHAVKPHTAREIAFIMERAVPLAEHAAAAYLRRRGLDAPTSPIFSRTRSDALGDEVRIPRHDRRGARPCRAIICHSSDLSAGR